MTERRLNHLRLNFIIADADVDLGAFFGEFGFYIAHADRFLKTGRLGARGYPADIIAFRIYYRVIVPRYAAVDHFNAYQLAFYAFLLLLLEGSRVGELFGEFGHPS